MVLGLLAFALLPPSVIVDTDAGTDDLMALAFLLSRPDVRVEAITVANGLAHVPRGGANVLRLLELSEHRGIPVYLGTETPLRKTADFPDAWRKISDDLPGVTLPQAHRSVEKVSAVDFLAGRLNTPATILALGPLTNLAQALQRNPNGAAQIRRLVMMGGALRVAGNLGDGGLYKTRNTTAEWNIFVDPKAAQIVFRSGAPIELVPLDATAKVPIDLAFLARAKRDAHSPLSRFVAQVLESDREAITGGYFQAWDPLAAVCLVDSATARWTLMTVSIRDDGTTVASSNGGRIEVALDADAPRFSRVFLGN